MLTIPCACMHSRGIFLVVSVCVCAPACMLYMCAWPKDCLAMNLLVVWGLTIWKSSDSDGRRVLENCITVSHALTINTAIIYAMLTNAEHQHATVVQMSNITTGTPKGVSD